MRKKAPQLKNLSLNKIKISKLTNSEFLNGGSGICSGKSDPVRNCYTVDYTNCPYCDSDQVNGC